MKKSDNRSTLLDNELDQLKQDLLKMWQLVISQLEKSKTALANIDKDLAREVVIKENMVNAYELKIDQSCEDIFALFSPVAVDLRFLLAILKINTNLERIGDIAEGIAKFVINMQNDFDVKLLEITRAIEMFDQASSITVEVRDAFEKEDTKIARKIFQKDELLDDINDQATHIIAACIKDETGIDKIEYTLYILSAMRKLERVGDHAKNMAEEIIFYTEAKVLKHQAGDTKN
jgi:phosphate transport system protein